MHGAQRTPPAAILVVEDDPGLRRLMERTLQREGHQACCVSTGAQAVNWLETNRADLMLLDYGLPDMSGEQLLALLARQQRTVPFIVATGHGSESVAVEMMKLGARDYLVKGDSFLPLLDTVVAQVLDQLDSERQLAEAEQKLRASESRYQTLVRVSPVGIMHFDREGRCLYVNERWCEIAGQPAETAIGDGWINRLHPDERESAVREWKAAAARGEELQRELRYLKGGGVGWALSHTLPQRDAYGQVTGFVRTVTDITERKRAEEDLRQQKEILQAVFESIPVALAFFEHEHLKMVNREWERVFGWSLEEAQGIDVIAAMYPNAADAQFVRDFIEKAEGAWHEFRTRDKSGQMHDMLWANIRLSTGINIGIGQDITERKRAENNLRLTEQRFRLAVDHVPDLFAIYDPQCRYQFVNSQTIRVGRIPREEFIGKTDEELFPAEATRQYVPILKKAIATRSAQSVECRIDTSGKPRYMLVSYVPILDDQGEVSQVLYTGHDLTERKLAEDALRESEGRLRALVDNLPFNFWATDSAGRYTMINPSGIAQWGDVTGRHPAESGLPSEIITTWISNNDRALAGEVVRGEIDYSVRGEGRSYFNIIAPIRAGDEIRGTVGVNIDITDLKRAEEKSRQLLSDLAHVDRVSSMGAMVSELAHEINQPLYAISNFAEACINTLKSGGDQQDLTKWMEQISRQAKRAGDIVRGLGQFVRKSPSRRSEADLNEVVHEVISLLNVDNRMEQLELELDLASGLPPVEIDRVQIQQVLLNLIVNAIEAMLPQADAVRRITIGTQTRGEIVQAYVRDTGPGIGSDRSERIFEPYHTTKPNGMGMGLVISKSIVEAHEGQIWAQSNQDLGTTFFFTLPIAAKDRKDEYAENDLRG